ncbi:MAG: energy-coupling factor transporter transmembrane protein EcfT [Clostridiales bacterium]|jgi:energy-coupling factor transport system permease protein|nr:energy-coupling factor transporter transmembrane protein EcfT [Clostridiales bacterium]
MSDSFSGYHPIVNMLYFASVIAFSMFFTHPVCLAVSLVCAFSYSVYLNGKKAVKFSLFYMFPVMIMTVLLNLAFNHKGSTILAYLPDGNPLTLESIIYGTVAAAMLVTVISWFSCFNTVMTSDKFVYLFGKIIPAMSLILSMALRFVPRFRAQIKVISNAQKCIGRDVSNGNIFQRAKHGIKILSIMVTWALENAIETADSMKARGYGLPGRTAFSIYRLDNRDMYALAFIFLCVAYIVSGALAGGLYFRYLPTVKGVTNSAFTISLYLVYLALSALPLTINIREDYKWKAIAPKN